MTIPIEYEIMAGLYKPRAKFIMLHTNQHFGKQTDGDHLLRRLDAWIETSQNQKVHDLYDYLMSGPEKEYRNFHPDLFLQDTHRGIDILNYYYNEDLLDTHHERLMNDLPTRIHMSCAGKFEKYLVKMINKLDHEAILQSKVEDLETDTEDDE